MQRHGARAEDFAPFAITAHNNALTNANALLHKAVDLYAYMESRIIVEPVRLFDASPICDGVAALVLASREVTERLNPAAACESPGPRQRPRRSRSHGGRICCTCKWLKFTRAALEQAGVAHRDVDLFELHDAYTIMSVLTLIRRLRGTRHRA